MHLIYSVASKDSTFDYQKKSKYVVLKEPDSNLFRAIIKDNKPTVEIIDNHKFKSFDKYLLTFKIEKNLSENLQKYLKEKLEDFLEKNGSIKQESINNFFKYLEADETYHFEQLEINEHLDKVIPKESTSGMKRRSVSLQNLSENLPFVIRPSSVGNLHENKILSGSNSSNLSDLEEKNSDTHSLTSFPDLTGSTESLKISGKSQSSILDKIRPFFSEQNETLFNINKHGTAIKKGYFNGKEKAEILLGISGLVDEIKSDTNRLVENTLTSKEDIEGLKQKISGLNTVIRDEKSFNTLSRYRGLSPFKCFATLWGGGRVKSIDYINQLKDQLDSLTEEISQVRSTI